MIKLIDRWFVKDARWYHFWLPQSGFLGGLIMGVTLWVIIFVFIW